MEPPFQGIFIYFPFKKAHFFTPLLPFPTSLRNLWALQEQVIASILQASKEQRAIAEAPKVLDPIQQTVSTTFRGYVHDPSVSRQDVLTALKCLGSPLPGVYLKTLRKAYDTFLLTRDINELLSSVNTFGQSLSGENGSTEPAAKKEKKELLKREDLKLICFDYVWH